MKRVLVTGASGFIGQHCLPFLQERGFEVWGLTHVRPFQTQSGIRLLQMDLFDEKEVVRVLDEVQPSHLLHLAWYAEPGKFWNADENAGWVTASRSLVQSFLDSGGERVVISGTCAEYDWSGDGICDEETTAVRPMSLYARSKHALHGEAEKLADSAGKQLAWARLFWLYGPMEDARRLVSSMIISLLKNEVATCHQPEIVRDYLHVADAGRAFSALVDSDFTGTMNIASGQAVRIGDLVRALAERTGGLDRVRYGSATTEDVAPIVVGKVRRLVDEIGWKPFFSLESGLDDAVSWWARQLNVDLESGPAGIRRGSPRHVS